jgi:dTDP-4-amino-4,6-dideoxygalactose transaminase
LSNVVTVPRVAESTTSVWAQYTITVPAGRRDVLAETLAGQGIPTAIYYPRSLQEQKAYAHFPVSKTGAFNSERLPREVLPMRPYLEPHQQDRIIAAIKDALH